MAAKAALLNICREGTPFDLELVKSWGLTLDDIRSSSFGRIHGWGVHEAVKNNNLPMLRALKSWGLTLDDARSNNNLALDLAVIGGYLELEDPSVVSSSWMDYMDGLGQ